MAIRTLLLACLLCSLGCGGGDSSNSDATASNDSSTNTESSSSSDQSADEGMMNEHGMSEDSGETTSPDEAMMAEDPGMMNEHGVEEGASSADAAMEAEYAGAGSEGMTEGNRTPRKPARPEKVEEWTPEQVADAIRETDLKAIAAIENYAEKTKGQARGVDQLKTWLTALSEKPVQNAAQSSGENSEESTYTDPGMEGYESSGGYDQTRGPSKKEQITHALLDAFATNSTKPAYEVLASIFSGQLVVGEDKNKAMEMAFVTLMKNVSDPNNPAEAQLLKAMTSVELDSAPPKKEKEEQSADALKKSVKELHLGFAIAAMNGLIGSRGKPAKGNQNNSNAYGAYDSAEAMNPSEGASQGKPAPEARPVKVAPIDLKPGDASKTLSYLWSDEMVAYAVAQLNKHPESSEAFVFASALPLPAARDAVRKVIDEHRLEPPNQWLHESVIASQLTDPAIHLLIKQFPREARPTGNQGSPPPARQKKDEDPNAVRRQEASYGWMDANEKTLLSLMQRMYEGSLLPGAKEYNPSGIPLSLHAGAEVTASMQFILPNPDQSSAGLDKAQQTIVNYVRIESDTMNNRTVMHYRNSLRDEQAVPILGNKGMWLDGEVKPNRKNGTLRSVDILLSKDGARPSMKPPSTQPANQQNSSESSEEAAYTNPGNYGGNGGGGTPVIEILTVEIPPPASEEEEEKVTAN